MYKSTCAVCTYGALAATLLTLAGQSAGAASVIDNWPIHLETFLARLGRTSRPYCRNCRH